MGVPIFVTKVKIGKGRDMVLISAECPGGDTSKGEVESVEAVRLVMSPLTFLEVTELFVQTLATMDVLSIRAGQSGIARPGMTAAPAPAHTEGPGGKEGPANTYEPRARGHSSRNH